ncbi:MAG: hypothetical protein IPK70_07040 [Flavobacteriales bacterium]|jgi:hypothetical protein|nr:hypothetical protein [Flavobacteriales bacterium]
MRQTLTALVLTGLTGAACAQVEIDHRIELAAPSDAERQVTGVPTLAEPSALQSAQQEQSNSHRVALASLDAAVWSATISTLATAPMAGTHIVLFAPEQTPEGELQLLLNGAGPFAVVHRIGDPVLGEEIVPDAPLSLVFDGERFHALSGTVHRPRECAGDLVAVSDQFCVEAAEREAASFFLAARTCAEAGRRLCTWGEWHNACRLRVELGLANMIGNWEYTDDTANEDNTVRIIGYSSCTIAGGFVVSTGTQAYRCCLTR